MDFILIALLYPHDIFYIMWYLWKWMNKALFEQGFQRHEKPTGTIMHLLKEIKMASRVQNKVRIQKPKIKHVQWYHSEGG